jgi:hypothetical protein
VDLIAKSRKRDDHQNQIIGRTGGELGNLKIDHTLIVLNSNPGASLQSPLDIKHRDCGKI